MRFVHTAVVAAVLSAGLLSACSSDGSSSSGSATTPGAASAPTDAAHRPLNKPEDLTVLDRITVTGDDPATDPAVTFSTLPVSVSATTVKTLKPGTGAASKAADRVTVRQALYLGGNGKQLDSRYKDKSSDSFLLSGSQTIPGLITALTGVKAGSRLLYAIPPAEAFGSAGNPQATIGPTDDLVVVADVISVVTPLKMATGTAMPPVAGQPSVTFDATNGPTITVPKAPAPSQLVSQLLIEGSGPVVQAGQTLTVHYTGAVWADGSVFDSSWKKGSPATFPIGTGSVIPGWDKGLVGKKVGSRVLLIVPPADGYADKQAGSIPANSTLVFVVDILDAG